MYAVEFLIFIILGNLDEDTMPSEVSVIIKLLVRFEAFDCLVILVFSLFAGGFMGSASFCSLDSLPPFSAIGVLFVSKA